MSRQQFNRHLCYIGDPLGGGGNFERPLGKIGSKAFATPVRFKLRLTASPPTELASAVQALAEIE